MSIPRHWRLHSQRYSMVGEVCNQCGAKLFPPRDVCPECSKPAYEPFTFSGNGRVYSHSTIYQAPAGRILSQIEAEIIEKFLDTTKYLAIIEAAERARNTLLVISALYNDPGMHIEGALEELDRALGYGVQQ